MLQLKIKLASLSHSVERKVTCNGNIYNINFPTDGNRFLDITDQITIKNEFEILISILAKKI